METKGNSPSKIYKTNHKNSLYYKGENENMQAINKKKFSHSPSFILI